MSALYKTLFEPFESTRDVVRCLDASQSAFTFHALYFVALTISWNFDFFGGESSLDR